MTVKVSHTAEIQNLFNEAAGLNNDQGSPRVKQIMLRLINDAAKIIEDLEITDDEFWKTVDYLNRLGGRNEVGLLVPGLGLEHFLDILQDAKDAEAGLTGGTPRTIEGPLYVAGAPDGPTQECLDLLGRHGQRPAHIHFFISAPGHRHLTTQINLAGEQYLWDDFAYATREGLIGDVTFVEGEAAARDRGFQGNRFAEVNFDFQLQSAPVPDAEQRNARPRALQ